MERYVRHDPKGETRIMHRIVLGLLTLWALSVAPLASAQEEATALAGEDLGLPEIQITVTDEGWDAPPELPAGRFLVTASYEGERDFGTVAFLRLPSGWSIDDLNDQLAESEAAESDQSSDGTDVNDSENAQPDLEWLYQLTLAGGVSPVSGGTAQGIVDLFPGDWAIWADHFTPAAIPLSVTGQMPAELPEPEASVTITESGSDEFFEFTVEGSLSSGQQLIKVVNASNQPHFVEFLQLSTSATSEQVSAHFQQLVGGTPVNEVDVPPGLEIWLSPLYASTQSPGSTQWMIATLAPGSYAMICWLPDPNHGNQPHALSGMIEVFEVSA